MGMNSSKEINVKTEAVENPQKLANKFLIGLNSMTEGKPLEQSQLWFYQKQKGQVSYSPKDAGIK